MNEIRTTAEIHEHANKIVMNLKEESLNKKWISLDDHKKILKKILSVVHDGNCQKSMDFIKKQIWKKQLEAEDE